MMNKTKLRNDIILIAALLVMAAIGLFAFFFLGRKGDSVVVIQDGEEIARYALTDTVKVDIKTSDGKLNTLVIEDGYAYILKADCPDKICVSHRKISREGEVIACLPHKLAISIEASGNK